MSEGSRCGPSAHKAEKADGAAQEAVKQREEASATAAPRGQWGPARKQWGLLSTFKRPVRPLAAEWIVGKSGRGETSQDPTTVVQTEDRRCLDCPVAGRHALGAKRTGSTDEVDGAKRRGRGKN